MGLDRPSLLESKERFTKEMKGETAPTHERTGTRERAVPIERTTFRERAVHDERARGLERVRLDERTVI